MNWEEREEDLEAHLNRGALWAITYGDLMSYLMIFFLLLYLGSATKSMKVQMSIKSITERFGGGQGQAIQELFSQYGVQKIARLEMNENKIRIVFQAPVLFDPASAKLKTDNMPQMHQLVDALKELPHPIQIEGHTDERPLGASSEFKSNRELSAARAFSILRFLEISGVDPQRLSAIGYGEFRPLSANAMPEGRAINRRIEINIMRRED